MKTAGLLDSTPVVIVMMRSAVKQAGLFVLMEFNSCI